MSDQKNYQEISIESLVPFANHPFKQYEGQRFDDMVESIRENGVLVPIVVRPIADKQYEILSGHNRVEAAKKAELTTVPAVVREDLSDDEAMLIVTETNLIQRSFEDMKYSERARCLKAHLDAIKHQGKRKDLVDEVERLLEAQSGEGETTSYPMDTKLRSTNKVGQKYDLSHASVARYVRIAELINALQARVDSEEIGFRVAVTLSYLTHDEQYDLDGVLTNKKYSITMEKAGKIRELSRKSCCTSDKIEAILSADVKEKAEKTVVIRVGQSVFSKHFPGIKKQEMAEVAAIVDKALEVYLRENPWKSGGEGLGKDGV